MRPRGLENPDDPGSRSSHPPAARIRRYQEELATSQHAVGLIQFGLGDLDDAFKSLSQASSLHESLAKGDPGTADIRRQLAQIHLAKGENDQALDLLNRDLATRPDDPLAFVLRGQALSKLGRVSQAEADFSKAVLLKPDDPKVWKLCGLSYAMSGLADEAATAFAKLMELTPQSKEPDLWWTPIPPGSATRSPVRRNLRPRCPVAAQGSDPAHRPLPLFRPPPALAGGRRHRGADHRARPRRRLGRLYHRSLLYHLGDFDGYQRESRLRLVVATAGPIEDRRKPQGGARPRITGVDPTDTTTTRRSAITRKRSRRATTAATDPDSSGARHGISEAGTIDRGPEGAGGRAEAAQWPGKGKRLQVRYLARGNRWVTGGPSGSTGESSSTRPRRSSSTIRSSRPTRSPRERPAEVAGRSPIRCN